MARTGYTLPVFAAAAAKAALLHLHHQPPTPPPTHVTLDLLPHPATLPLEQVARLDPITALAIARSDPGDNLDLTRHTPVWAWVQWGDRQDSPLILEGGAGLGHTATGEAAIYDYAQRLLLTNLTPLIPPHRSATVRIILPEGYQLAQRTSNAAFGILDGLALLGTSGLARPLSAADQLDTFRHHLTTTLPHHPHIALVIGSHGHQVAQRLGIPPAAIVQAGNWLGAMLVTAALEGAQSVLLIGYQGKLIKLAGGIFHTSSHLADGRLEIIAAAIARCGGAYPLIQAVLNAPTADAAHALLQAQGQAAPIFQYLAQTIHHKAQTYVEKYADRTLPIGVVLGDRQGQIIAQDDLAPLLQRQASPLSPPNPIDHPRPIM